MNPINRRKALKTISATFGSLAFAAMTTGEVLAATKDPDNPLASKKTHFPAKAKRVIMLFMNGAPSHVDTFDYKPDLVRQSGGSGDTKLLAPLWKFRKRGKSGLWISDLFPSIAEHADELCLLRSMQSDQPNHPSAEKAAHTGTAQFIRPSIGAWSVYGLGTENVDLPGFIAIGGGGRAPTAVTQGSAFLPARYAATNVNTGFADGRRGGGGSSDPVPNISNKLMTSKAQRTQLD